MLYRLISRDIVFSRLEILWSDRSQVEVQRRYREHREICQDPTCILEIYELETAPHGYEVTAFYNDDPEHYGFGFAIAIPVPGTSVLKTGIFRSPEEMHTEVPGTRTAITLTEARSGYHELEGLGGHK